MSIYEAVAKYQEEIVSLRYSAAYVVAVYEAGDHYNGKWASYWLMYHIEQLIYIRGYIFDMVLGPDLAFTLWHDQLVERW